MDKNQLTAFVLSGAQDHVPLGILKTQNNISRHQNLDMISKRIHITE